MEQRRLGPDLAVSAIGLGCMGMSFAYGGQPEADSIRTLHRAVEVGVTLFDTAEVYGPFENEELVGRALKGVRDRIIIATKFGFKISDEGRGPERMIGVDSRPEHVREVCDASLKRLGVDVLDLFYQHRVDPAVPIEDTVGAMADLVRAGKVRSLGLSEASAATIRRAHAVHPIAAVQSEYSLWSREREAEVLPVCRELGIGFVPYSPLGRGLLTGAIRDRESLGADDFRRTLPRFEAENLVANQALIDTLAALADEKGVTAAQLALAWVLHQGDFIVPIPGARKVRHLKENAAAVDVILTPADLAAMETAMPQTAVSGRRYTADGHPDFPIQNLPFGVFSRGGVRRCGVAIGDMILDLAALADSGMIEGEPQEAALAASGRSLNPLLAMFPAARRSLRRCLSTLLSDVTLRSVTEPMLLRAADCEMHVPARIGDYTDFYVGIHHATNVGKLFRPENPLLPNYKHVPIGYHGRASSVVPSGTDVMRPAGQVREAGSERPVFAPTRRLDYELELGVWIGHGNARGTPIPIAEANAHVAGLCLLNDWSARDVQAWEYQPLGPFLSKSFMTTVSPWIVTAEALAPFRVAQPPRPEGDPTPLGYLTDAADQKHGAFSITLEVHLATALMRREGLAPFRLSRGPATSMYWTVGQMVTHHASNGCDLRPGDLLGTGTISSPEREGFGSLLEIGRGGTEPATLPSGETRCFLEDGDELSMTARATAPGRVAIGFGSCVGRVKAADAR